MMSTSAHDLIPYPLRWVSLIYRTTSFLGLISLQSEDTGDYDCEIDLDELLDLETDVERRNFVQVSDQKNESS